MPEFYLADARQVAEAVQLMVDFGRLAPAEAETRAGRSRDLGNVVHFCRWRQTGRLIDFLAHGASSGMLH